MFGQEPSQMIAGCLGGGIMFSANWTAIYTAAVLITLHKISCLDLKQFTFKPLQYSYSYLENIEFPYCPVLLF